jgi:hypothetical protein
MLTETQVFFFLGHKRGEIRFIMFNILVLKGKVLQ